jgi:Fe-S-cluster containining protein
MTQQESPQSSDLCTACGMCCAGPLFNVVMIDIEQFMHALSIGLPIRDEGYGPGIWFPCPKLVDKCCTVYEDRPDCCRAFRCELLKKIDREEVTLDAAMAIVAQALDAVQEAEAAMAGETFPNFRKRRVEALERGERLPPSEALDRLVDLDLILDEHFRRPEQSQTAAYAEIEGRAPPEPTG